MPELVRNAANERLFRRLEREHRPWPPHADGRPRDPFLEEGGHPDCVERVWKVLAAALPFDGRLQALGAPVLADPSTGEVWALPIGTAYALRLTGSAHEEAVAAGLRPVHRWGSGAVTDVEEELGAGWLFGAWKAEEVDWLRTSAAG